MEDFLLVDLGQVYTWLHESRFQEKYLYIVSYEVERDVSVVI